MKYSIANFRLTRANDDWSLLLRLEQEAQSKLNRLRKETVSQLENELREGDKLRLWYEGGYIEECVFSHVGTWHIYTDSGHGHPLVNLSRIDRMI